MREGIPGSKDTELSSVGARAEKPLVVRCSDGTWSGHEARFILRALGARVGTRHRRAGHCCALESGLAIA